MQNIDNIKEAGKTKLVGYNERELECFVQGAMYMAGHLPQKRSDEWYEEQARRKQEGTERAESLSEHFKDVTGLGKAVENLKSRKAVNECVDDALAVVFKNILDNPAYRATMLELLGAVDKAAMIEMIQDIQMTCKAFNERHDTQLSFTQLEENEGRWTLAWDEPLK